MPLKIARKTHTLTVGSTQLPTVNRVTGRLGTSYQFLLVCSNCITCFEICNKQLKLYDLVPCPRHIGFACEGSYLSFHISLIKHWTFLAYKFYALCFYFCFHFIKTAMLLPTLTYHTTDPYPLWISLITTLLLPVMTSKIRSTKPRTEVRMIVRCLENLLDCYYKKKGPYNLMKI